MKGVLAIDFDGTVVKHSFPKIGEPLPDAFRVLRKLREAGWLLVLWTCREDIGYEIKRQYLRDAVTFCKDEHDFEFDAVNETILDFDFRSDYDCLKRKPHVTWFIDDSNVGGFLGWKTIEEILIEGKNITWQLS